MPQIGRYAAGELIFREGDPGSFACLVRMGEVELYHAREGGKILVATVTEGQMFGELALVDGAPRMAATIALRLSKGRRARTRSATQDECS